MISADKPIRNLARRREFFTCVLGALLFVVGGSIFYVQPIFSAAFSRDLHLPASAIGLIDSLETGSLALAAIGMAFALRRFGPAFILGSAVVVAVGNLATGFMPNEASLAVVRTFTALFGEGPLLAYSFVVIGKMRRPERGFGIATATAVACGTAAIQPILQIRLLGDGASMAIAVFLSIPAVLLLLIVLRKPDMVSMRGILERASVPTLDPSGVSKSGFVSRLLIGQLIWSAAPGLVWPFAAQYAHQAGAKDTDIVLAFSIANVLGLLGAVVPALAGARISYRAGIIAGSTGLALVALLLSFASNTFALTACFAGFIIFWCVGQIYQPAQLVASDRVGRSAALVPVVQLAGSTAGTALGGLAIREFGIQILPIFCVVAVAIATPLFFTVPRSRGVALSQTRSG